MAPYRSRTDEKMVPSRCLAALSLPPGQLAPQVSPRPAITQNKFHRRSGAIGIFSALQKIPLLGYHPHLTCITMFKIFQNSGGFWAGGRAVPGMSHWRTDCCTVTCRTVGWEGERRSGERS
ncbi:hypothetical protein THAOC_05076 [Thalassiosira oceanica]|uniref:Uncharacterized protein n=1 Tax=Thalassiosira oceanica TaxID=159749 RepID=K0T881_THAOC|nr:hypothetical protein THAOC_05076 [Thalassiosira oceanica]|eukprot:EJK73309.1 hypothetical protein THAOC_05076 [Thalassiosira oceanica]